MLPKWERGEEEPLRLGRPRDALDDAARVGGEERSSRPKAGTGVLRGAGRPEGGAAEREEGAVRRGAGRGLAVTQGGQFKPKEGNAAAPREVGVGVAIAGPPWGRGRGFSPAHPAALPLSPPARQPRRPARPRPCGGPSVSRWAGAGDPRCVPASGPLGVPSLASHFAFQVLGLERRPEAVHVPRSAPGDTHPPSAFRWLSGPGVLAAQLSLPRQPGLGTAPGGAPWWDRYPAAREQHPRE